MNIIQTVNSLNANSRIKILFIFSIFLNLNIYGQNLNNGGSIGNNTFVCPGETPSTIVNLTYPSGGNNSNAIEYLWMTRTNSSPDWSIAPGVNNEESYSPTPVGVTTYYLRCSRRAGFTNYVETSIVSVTVLTNPTANINGNPGSTSVGSTVNFSASYSNNSTYSWDFDGDGNIDCTGQNCSNTFNTSGNFTVSLTVDNGSCSVTIFEQITIIMPSSENNTNACSCNNNQDFSTAEGYFVRDFIHITSGTSENWQILGINSGAIYNGSATPILAGKDIPEVTNVAGSYYISFWFKSGEGYDLNLSNGSNTISAATVDPCTCISALPVEMVSFEALLHNTREEVTLKWTTASELNNSHFELQRSLDGNRFDYLNVMAGQGNSNQFQSYSFVDKNPVPGVNYYRLKQVDFDGTQTYSNIVSAKISSESVIASVIPNPVNDRAIVRFGEKLPERSKLQILSSMGQVLATYLVENTLSQEINLDRFEKGIYFLRIKNAERKEKAFFKIVKF
ncbi:MAG: PKD domain-containing protein [Saprospiraceae bacterium]